jgi:hypothetical protein
LDQGDFLLHTLTPRGGGVDDRLGESDVGGQGKKGGRKKKRIRRKTRERGTITFIFLSE